MRACEVIQAPFFSISMVYSADRDSPLVVFEVRGFEVLEPELEDVGVLHWLLVLSLRPLVTVG